MNTKALIEASSSRAGLLKVAERLGALLPDNESLQELAKGLTGTLPENCDEYAYGMREALLEMLCSAETCRLNRAYKEYCDRHPEPIKEQS